MKKLFLLLLFPIVSFGQSPYSSYYKNSKTKETGLGYTEKFKYKVSAKKRLNLRESPDLKSNKICNIPYDTVLYVVDKTVIKLTLIDTDKETGSI